MKIDHQVMTNDLEPSGWSWREAIVMRLRHLLGICTRVPHVAWRGEGERPVRLGTICPVCWKEYPLG